MTLIDILLTTIIITLFCFGVRTLFSDGMILHWVRKPYENKKRPGKYDWMLKPFILCVVCFASVWGGGVFVSLHGLHWEIIICCVSATFIIKVINDKVEF